jgi:molecular chaperone GrpE (heat shock protein)
MDYVESLKREADEGRHRAEQAEQLLAELRKQDWSKQIIELKGENELLREEVAHKHKEFANLKNNLAMAIQTSATPANVQSHLTNLLETQS